jgi:hypothetical protein
MERRSFVHYGGRINWGCRCGGASFFDMFSISDKKVGKIAWNHMILNLIAVVIFAVDFLFALG